MSQKEHRRRILVRFLDTLNGTWRLRAACDPHNGIVPAHRIPRFFAEDSSADGEAGELSLQQQREAALFCNTACSVQAECLAFARDVGEEHWVWGGTTDTERRLLMRRDRKARKSA